MPNEMTRSVIVWFQNYLILWVKINYREKLAFASLTLEVLHLVLTIVQNRNGNPRSAAKIDRGGGRVVVNRPIAELKLDPFNPRVHPSAQLCKIARSIEAFGFNVPVLVDSKLRVIAGHGRILACQTLGWTEVPTICLDHLTEAQARAFKIADNRLTEIATWDDRLLAEQLKELSALDLDFSLETTGFNTGEIDLRIESLTPTQDGADDPADALPEVQSGPAVNRPGDLWHLGRHRVCCGSALEAAAYQALMQGERAAMAFTDPPYNVQIEGNVSGLGAIHHREFAMASGEMTADAFTDFLAGAMMALVKNTVPGSIHFYFIDWRHIGETLDAAIAARLLQLNMCVWVKDTAGMGSLYRSQHELVFVFKNGRERHHNNVELGRFGRNRTNIWNYPGAIGLRSSDEGNLIALHATPKPVTMVADAIMDVTARGDIVLDPFLGSGTSIIAAERTGRRCYGIEIDPLYCDVIVRRWQAFTRGEARHAASGRTFDDLATERKSHNDQK
jgi:DNA modification methylase